MKFLVTLFTTVLFAATTLCGFAADQFDRNQSTLPPAAQAAISSALGRDQSSYAVRSAAQGFRAENAAQDLAVSFTAEGVEARRGSAYWQMPLVAYGYGAQLSSIAAAAPQASGNRVEYKRGLLTEWYVNGPFGLEQGFTLATRPNHSGTSVEPLTLALAFSSNLKARVNASSDGMILADNTGDHLRYTGLTAYDADGKLLRSWLELSGDRLLLRVADAGARYPLVVDPFIQEAALTTTVDKGFLGLWVSISGNTIVASDGSSAYVFVEPASGWTSATETAHLTSTDNGPMGAVGISGNTIVVGSGQGPAGFGEAYVFVKPTGGWTDMTQTAVLGASDGFMGDFYGVSVAIGGDTIVVGANQSGSVGTHYPSEETGPGAAYVYVKPTAGWKNANETAKLTASDGANGDNLGYSVGISGNVIVAGAPNAIISSGSKTFGAVYVFTKPSTGWTSETQAAKLTLATTAVQDAFGITLAIRGTTIAACAVEGVFVFAEPSGGWTNGTQTAQLTDSSPYITLGNDALAVGNNMIVVGTGVVVDVFVEPSGGWVNMTQSAHLRKPTGAVEYGNSVSVSGATIVVGSPGQGGTSFPDVVYVFGPG